jgi:hypothetical protein
MIPFRTTGPWPEQLSDPGLTILLGLQVLLVFIVAPAQAVGVPLPNVVPELLEAVLVVAVVTLAGSRTLIMVAFAVGLLVVAAVVVSAEIPSSLTKALHFGATLLGLGLLSWIVLRSVFAPGKVTMHRVRGAVVAYLNAGLLFTAAYRLVWELAPHAFSGLSVAPENPSSLAEMLYFSFTTLTTTGYGDITPVHPVARSLANLEGIVGQVFPATYLARIVTLQLRDTPRR